MKMFNPLVVCYAIDYKPEYRNFIKVEATQFSEDHTMVIKWAVRESSSVMSKYTGDFVYEPRSSSRDDDFYTEFRFDTVEEAVACYQKFHKQ
jgi:hypothetical protein